MEGEPDPTLTAVLVDHNMEGQAVLLWGALAAGGWLALCPLRMVSLADVGLPFDMSDRVVWRFAQTHHMLILTANRQMRDPDSLEQTLRDENTPTSLPVITISNVDRVDEKAYREACAVRLIEIVLDLRQYLGVGRIFIP